MEAKNAVMPKPSPKKKVLLREQDTRLKFGTSIVCLDQVQGAYALPPWAPL